MTPIVLGTCALTATLFLLARETLDASAAERAAWRAARRAAERPDFELNNREYRTRSGGRFDEVYVPTTRVSARASWGWNMHLDGARNALTIELPGTRQFLVLEYGKFSRWRPDRTLELSGCLVFLDGILWFQMRPSIDPPPAARTGPLA